jgi:hypothetical protein
MLIFFYRKYHVEGGYVPVKLGLKDIIFVMEDVDAASKVVKRWDGLTTLDVMEPESIHLPTPPKSLFRMFLESTNSDCKDLLKELTEKSDRLKKEVEAQKPEVLRAIAQCLTIHPALGLVGGLHPGMTPQSLACAHEPWNPIPSKTINAPNWIRFSLPRPKPSRLCYSPEPRLMISWPTNYLARLTLSPVTLFR